MDNTVGSTPSYKGRGRERELLVFFGGECGFSGEAFRYTEQTQECIGEILNEARFFDAIREIKFHVLLYGKTYPVET